MQPDATASKGAKKASLQMASGFRRRHVHPAYFAAPRRDTARPLLPDPASSAVMLSWRLRGDMAMLELRSNCECCNKDLPPHAEDVLMLF
jgi:hypothetical protein